MYAKINNGETSYFTILDLHGNYWDFHCLELVALPSTVKYHQYTYTYSFSNSNLVYTRNDGLEKVELNMRIIPMESIAINSLKDNYEILKKELDIDNQAFIEKFELDYDKNEIKMLSYTVKDINNNKYYYISNNNNLM